jgi:protein-L-isoaspartate O-methyltransferase
MIENILPAIYLLASVGFIMAVKWMNNPATARRGVIIGEIGMVLAVIGTLLRVESNFAMIFIGIGIGAAIGAPLAYLMPMTAVPQRTAFSHAFGAKTVLFTTSPGKAEDAKRLGADEVVISKDAAQMNSHAGSFDFILNTVAASHNLDNFLNLLKRDGTMVLLGAPEHPHPSPNVMSLIFRRRSIAGSLIGGLAETQEMLDFCAEHNVTCDVEVIAMQDINDAYERMLTSDVKYRFVIDMSSLKTNS